jgi:coenzyme F420-0:L-glutamate ligase/coenzyme F420-1:gamma-L-glutamate ligase
MTGFAVELLAAPELPLVQPGHDLGGLIVAAFGRSGVALRGRDVVVVAQKIVSKAEGRVVDLATVAPSARAVALGREIGKDPRLVEVILSESVRVVRTRPKLLIVEHRLGFIMANGGVDQSNVAEPGGAQCALLLPENPDASAAALRERLQVLTGATVAVVINDSFGRAWRIGTVAALSKPAWSALPTRSRRPPRC